MLKIVIFAKVYNLPEIKMKIWFVWETNAWKSTLFNKFFGSFRAIVSDVAWTTRENIQERIPWETEEDLEKIKNNDKITEENYKDFLKEAIIVDSPGLDAFNEEFPYIKKIIDDSDVIVFVIDWKWSITENIQQIADYIRKSWKEDRTILAVNKIDTTNPSQISMALAEWYWLWFDNVVWISAKHNFNLDELREKIEEIRKKYNIKLLNKNENKPIPVTFVWRINVWKSTLFNSIIWKDFSKVSDKWWTTLDYLTYPVKINGKTYEIIDTAWFRRKWKIHWLEKIAVKDKLEGMLKLKKPVIVVLFDISEWVTHRDMTVLWEILKKWLPVVVALNKIDDVDEAVIKQYKRDLRNWMRFAPWIPVAMISWKEKKWINQLFKMIDLVHENSQILIPTSALNNLIQTAYIKNPPKLPKNKSIKVKYITQDKENPNRFIVFVNKKDNVNFAFKKWLENVIRKEYGFFWVPLNFEFREEKNKKTN